MAVNVLNWIQEKRWECSSGFKEDCQEWIWAPTKYWAPKQGRTAKSLYTNWKDTL